MNATAAIFGQSFSDDPLRAAFLKWQCRVRQLGMRDNEGRPDDATSPDLILDGETQSMGCIITLMNKSAAASLVPEMLHIARQTNDPAQRRSKALQFLSATYYQKHTEFSDILTATFPAHSLGAEKILASPKCTLVYEVYAQRFDLQCTVHRLTDHNPLYQSTLAHNRLFNPNLSADIIVLGFEPDWAASTATPPFGAR